MRLKKIISNILTVGILLNNILAPINSLAGILSEDGRYETFEGSNITINDILEDDKVDIEIEGNTLVNIGIKKSPITSHCSDITFENNIIKAVSTNPDDAGFYFEPTSEAIDMMRGKTITIFLYGTQVSSVAPILVFNRTTKTYYGDKVYMGIDKQDLILKAEIPDNISNTDDLEIIIMNPKGLSSWTQIENKLMILEGDWTNKKAPDYFEGMKSVGEIENNKLTIISNSKNTYNIKPSENGLNITSDYQYKEDRKTIVLNKPLRALPNGVKDKIVKKNGKWFIERNCKEIVFDGSDDEQWDKRSYAFPSETTQLFCFDIKDKNAVRYNMKSIRCDRFIPRGGTGESQRKWECLFISENGNGVGIYLRIDNSKLDTLTSDGLKKWFANNPTTVVYQLITPTYELLEVEPTLNIYTDITHISNNSIIPANMKTTVDRAINRTVQCINLAKENPTVENLSKARYWSNLLRESIKKDQLQEEISSITDLNDMQLERKSSTSNVDVYIKSENMLSMSLNTNSITFEDFSGIEDMEKVNAINININSSLPYQLNAYLSTEIQNSDKSNIIDKNIVNVKENSESVYQVFPNTVDKIVLKNNCSAGNDLSHGIDIKLKGGIAHEKDVYKTTIKFEVEQE